MQEAQFLAFHCVQNYRFKNLDFGIEKEKQNDRLLLSTLLIQNELPLKIKNSSSRREFVVISRLNCCTFTDVIQKRR